MIKSGTLGNVGTALLNQLKYVTQNEDTQYILNFNHHFKENCYKPFPVIILCIL